MVEDLPFREQKTGDALYERTFSVDVDPMELKWHYDQEDRIVTVLEGADWKIQFDNQLPTEMSGEVFIPKGIYHRVIKGSGPLRISVEKLF
jgi:hypothetical protein